ncbi:charged multivesicular body protein 6-A-like [Paramacrobiotus metropolitanus]|uniref:charged multivesicular body protein 6-A-like n=1 Tax=Paramacrobiotus metropolitanus TaxID=2943436 RepID=UPI0024465BD8|nr:charged multivesicular body protein 6-A-like [Paramacrobiotus metropolitanus]XP_055351384.1 charged multivesicular body protein 6-A-like [Paramacrobiotus metropolitanus]
MGNLFGKSKSESRVTEHDKAVLQLKVQRDKVRQYQRRIEITMEKERQLAKRLIQDGKRDRAKLMLRKKRFEESMLAKVEQQLENLDQLLMNLEFTQIEQQVIHGLKVGNDCLKKLHETFRLEDVEKILDESRAGVEYQQEIDSLLSGSISAEDDEAVEEEFEQLFANQLPDVPQDIPVSQEIGDARRDKVPARAQRTREALPAS